MYEHECVRLAVPTDLDTVRTVTDAFRQHYNYGRPNQAVRCASRKVSPFRRSHPAPRFLRWSILSARLEVLDRQRDVRKVLNNGTVSVDSMAYFVDRAWAGKYVGLRIDAVNRTFVVEYRGQVLKHSRLKRSSASGSSGKRI